MTDNIQNGEGVELLPCPICDAQPMRNGRFGKGGVVCAGDLRTVGRLHRLQTYGADQAEADTAWNTRHSLAREPATADVERERVRIAAIIDPDASLPQWRQFNRDMWQGRQDAALAKADRVIEALSRVTPSSEQLELNTKGHHRTCGCIACMEKRKHSSSSEPAIAEGELRSIIVNAVEDAANDDCTPSEAVSRIPSALAAKSTPPASKGVEAIEDALAGWRYIRSNHGDLYGVAWDRVESGLVSLLDKDFI